MFGDEPFLGQIELIIDAKTRLVMPKETKIEPNENIVIIKDENLKLYEIHSEKTLSNRFEEINKLLIKAQTKHEEIYYKKKIYELSKNIIKKIKIDKNRRALLGPTFKPNTKVNLLGANDYLILELTK